MRNGTMRPRSALALLLCGLIAAACCIGPTSVAAAFGLRGGGHIGRGFARRPAPHRRIARGPSRWRERRLPREGRIITRRPNRGEIRTGRSTGGGIGAGTAGGRGGSGGGSQIPPRGETRFVPDEVITAFASDATAQTIDRLARRYRLTRLEAQNFPLINTSLYRWRIRGRRSVVSMIQALGGENIVASVQPNYLFTLQQGASTGPAGAPGDPAQYVLAELQVVRAQKIATGEHVAVAVIDSAIDAKHPDLGGTIVKSFDALNYDERPHAHGTSIAGAIAAHGKLLGIAPRAPIFAVHAFDDTPGEARGTSFAVYKGLQWAADNAARVVNMSFAGPRDAMLGRMLASAYDKGIVLIAAAGNGGPDAAPAYPAADPDVIAVAATDSDHHLFKMDNRGSYIAVSAPGVDVLALAPGDAYQVTTGSSIAAAHVSGIAALLLERNPKLTPKDIRNALIATATPLGASHPNAEFGAGLVNAYRAVALLDHAPAPAQDGGEEAKK